MKASDIRDQMLRIEGFSDGIKEGAQLFAKWMTAVLAEEEKSKEVKE